MERVKKDHRISKASAIAMTKRFRNGRGRIVKPGLKAESILPTCETFDRNGFDLLLAQPGCAGVRAYYAMNEQDQVHLVFVAVDANGKDILTATTSEKQLESISGDATNDAVLLDNSSRCPEYCPEPSELNS